MNFTHFAETERQNSLLIPKETASVKLSKLSIPKFYGDVSIFEIRKNRQYTKMNLNKTDRFDNINVYLRDKAERAMNDFARTIKKYHSITQQIEKRFVGKDLLINVYTNNFLNIENIHKVIY